MNPAGIFVNGIWKSAKSLMVHKHVYTSELGEQLERYGLLRCSCGKTEIYAVLPGVQQ